MKRYMELSEDELLGLSSAELQDLIDLECANKGIPLLPPKPVEPTMGIPEPTVSVYTVCNFTFLDVQDATKLMDFINSSSVVDLNKDYQAGDASWIRPYQTYSRPMVTESKAFTAEQWEGIRQIIDEYKKDKQRYVEHKKLYDEISSKRMDIADEISERISELTDKRAEIEWVVQEFKRYVALAEGDKGTALIFFKAAHPAKAEKHIGTIKALMEG